MGFSDAGELRKLLASWVSGSSGRSGALTGKSPPPPPRAWEPSLPDHTGAAGKGQGEARATQG